MHESGVMDTIIFTINSKLKESGVSSRVSKVNVLVGELEQVTGEHLAFHFRERVKGTPLEKAKFNFKKIKAKFRCRSCNHEFSVKEGANGCPRCRGNVTDVIAGTGIVVESVEVD